MLHSGCFYSSQASWVGTSQMYVSSHRYSSVNKREAEAEDQDQWPYRACRPSPYLFCHHGKFAALWTTLLRPRLTNELASRSLCRYYRGTHWPAITAASPQNKQVNPAPIPSHSLPGAVSPSNSHLLEGEETQRHLCTSALGTATEVLNITCRQQVTFHHTHLRVELLINNSPHTEKLIRFLLCRNNELHY